MHWPQEGALVKLEELSKNMGEVLRLAVSQAQRRRGLFKCTSFRRIDLSGTSKDPFSGMCQLCGLRLYLAHRTPTPLVDGHQWLMKTLIHDSH